MPTCLGFISDHRGAMTHQRFGKAVLLSNITEVSRAAGLKPDVLPKLSIVLGSKDME